MRLQFKLCDVGTVLMVRVWWRGQRYRITRFRLPLGIQIPPYRLKLQWRRVIARLRSDQQAIVAHDANYRRFLARKKIYG